MPPHHDEARALPGWVRFAGVLLFCNPILLQWVLLSDPVICLLYLAGFSWWHDLRRSYGQRARVIIACMVSGTALLVALSALTTLIQRGAPSPHCPPGWGSEVLLDHEDALKAAGVFLCGTLLGPVLAAWLERRGRRHLPVLLGLCAVSLLTAAVLTLAGTARWLHSPPLSLYGVARAPVVPAGLLSLCVRPPERLAPPLHWLIAAMVGLGLSAWQLRGVAAQLRLLRARGRWRVATYDAGLIRFPDGTPPARAPLGADLPAWAGPDTGRGPAEAPAPVPVIVVTGRLAQPGAGADRGPRPATYRDAGSVGPVHVEVGTPDEVAERLEVAVLTRLSAALCTSCLCATPLVVAGAMGRLWPWTWPFPW